MNHVDDNDAIRIEPDPDKLLAYHRQQLSAMLDGELSPDQAKFMLRRLQHDRELAACWERWQICGDILRGAHHALLPSDFAERVARRLHEDGAGAEAQARHGASPRRLRWAGGAALAASVALVAVFATRQLPGPTPASPTTPVQPMVAGGAPVATPESGSAVADAGSVLDAAPAGEPAGIPADPVPGAAPAALAAVAVAAAEAPRRAVERRAASQRPRTAPSRRGVGGVEQDAAGAMTMVAAVPAEPATVAPDDAGAVFAPATLPQPRPWPRPLLPGATGSAFNTDYGRPQAVPDQGEAFEPFRPRIALPPVLPPGSMDAIPEAGRMD